MKGRGQEKAQPPKRPEKIKRPEKTIEKYAANDSARKAKMPCADYCARMGDHDQTIPI